ncbi:MAG: PfkB family carbohydrate kinase [Anaerolineae bacterium]
MIVAIGNPVYDEIQTPFVRTEARVLSGCSTNACLVLRKLGYKDVCLVGNIGPDFREPFERDMARFGLAYEVRLSPQTGGFRLVYNHTGDRTLDVLGVAGPVRHLPTRWEGVEFVLFGPILQEVDLDLIRQVRERTDAPLFLDPQGLLREQVGGRIVHRPHPQMAEIVPLFHVVKANEHEAEVMTGIHPRRDPHGAVQAIYDMGCAMAIVTLAEAGSVVYDGRTFYDIPAYATVARDPTGAGDSYAGAFIYRYLQTEHPLENLWSIACFASAVASVMVEYTGPDFPLTLEEAERRTQVLLSQRD